MLFTYSMAKAASMLPLAPPPNGGGDGNPFGGVSPQAPPGSEMIQDVVGYVQWIAGICILGLFFGGIVAATAGRLWDHHGSGRLGARMIVGSLALAVLFGLGYTLVSQFAGVEGQAAGGGGK